MDTAGKIVFLENRLHLLKTRLDKDNEGVCRKIRRQIRKLKKSR